MATTLVPVDAAATLACDRHLLVAVDDSEVRARGRVRRLSLNPAPCPLLPLNPAPPRLCPLNPAPPPTAFSIIHQTQDAQRALTWVLANLARPGDAVHLAHALPESAAASLQVHPGMWIPVEDEDAPGGVAEREEEAAAAAAVAMVRRRFVPALAASGLAFEVHLLSVPNDEPASIAAAVAAKAAALGAACVVVAHHPASPLRSWWRGSVSVDVTKKAGVPTLVVH